MKHRRRKTALLSAAAAAVLVLQGSFAALAASPQFAYDADTWAKLQDNVMEYSELPYLVQEYNPTYLNNQTTYQAGRDTKNAKEVQDKQYNQANDLYDSADNLRDQADQIEDYLAVPGMASAYASLMSASVMVEQNALKTQQSADASYRDSEMDRLDYMNSQDAVVVQVEAAFAAYNQVKKTIPLMEKSLELQELTLQMTQKRQQLGQATQIDVLNAQKSLQSLQSTLTQTKAGLQTQHQQLCVQTGWTYDAEPDIQDLPGVQAHCRLIQNDHFRISQQRAGYTHPLTALQQNLSLQSNKRGYANMAEGSADKKNMDRTIKNQEQTIRSSMQTLYNDIMQKQTALQLADASLAAETQAMNAMQKKLELGMATQMEYKSEEVSVLEKQIDKETANMNLQQAIEMYEWALKGYMK